jgi:hypothetical protein
MALNDQESKDILPKPGISNHDIIRIVADIVSHASTLSRAPLFLDYEKFKIRAPQQLNWSMEEWVDYVREPIVEAITQAAIGTIYSDEMQERLRKLFTEAYG